MWTGGPGRLVVRGKGRRQDRLPLPAEVGEALVAYLSRRERDPRATGTCSSPAGPRAARSARTWSVTSSSGPADVPGYPRWGRTGSATPWPLSCCAAAPAWSRSARCLRHQDLATTALYAKVDLGALRTGRPALARGQSGERARADPRRLPAAASLAGTRTGRGRPGCCPASWPTSTPMARRTVTIEAALDVGAAGSTRVTVTTVGPRRMTAVRGFARYLAGIDPATEVPPLGLMPHRQRWRASVHLLPGRHRRDDGPGPRVDRLAAAGGDLPHPDRAAGGQRAADRGGDQARPRTTSTGPMACC